MTGSTAAEMTRQALIVWGGWPGRRPVLAGWHGGIVDSYRDRSEYLHLVGGHFACHPGRLPEDRVPDEDDNAVPHTVEIVARDHPITAGCRTSY